MLITPAEAARELGITKTAVYKYYRGEPNTWPAFILRTDAGKIKIDSAHPDYIKKLQWKRHGIGEMDRKSKQQGGKRMKKIKDAIKGLSQQPVNQVEQETPPEETAPKEAPPVETPPPKIQAIAPPPQGMRPPQYKPPEDETTNITAAAAIAEMKKIIYTSEIQEQKAIQEKIKTMQIKKDLAPVNLVEHFFSFAENLIQRIYRRPHEISPQLEALYIGKEDKKAVQLIIRELESIVKDVQKELLVAIDEEGYKKQVVKK